ncbi:hypothetical protein J437_LFUL019633 [Ladona fulva]|uniref:Cytochrome P450 n=1 Tax=Ladona fulva TaxID=123851 RepID=A0A8K0KHW8_LADFU|nr:hypothetical protein J437_LFUL019633 [Ladona fulva]
MWFLVAILVVLLVYWVFSKPNNFPPGPPRLPLVGSLPFINTRKEPLFHIALENTGKIWG